MALPLPLAFGFTNLALLGWLAAAAAPILIHLWMRHTHRDTPWAAIEFLREAIKRHARRLQLQQWILLALRTLVIVLIVLAAAKPYLSGWSPPGTGPTVHRLLVFDASMSMQYLAEGESRFERAKQLAVEMIDDAPTGVVHSVALMAAPPRSVVALPVADQQRLEREVQRLEPTSGSVDLGETLAHVKKLLEDARQNNKNIARQEVVVFTDLGQHPWRLATSNEAETPANPLIQEQLRALDDLGDVVIIDTGSVDAANIALSDLRVAGSLATTVEPVRVATELTNFSQSPTDKVVVQLLVNGSPIDEQTATLGPSQSTTLTFDVPFDVPAWHQLSARTAGDALPTDDQAWLAINVPERVRILCVEGEPRAARYVARALNPSGEPTSPLEPIVVAEGALAEVALDDYKCVFLCNVSQFTDSEVAILSRYVENGGGLVLFLGDRVLADAYNNTLVSSTPTRDYSSIRTVAFQPPGDRPVDVSRSLLPARIGEIVSGDNFSIDPLDYQHPIVAAFRGRERSGLLTTPLSAYLRLEPLTEQRVQVALATSNGDPLLITQPYGKGTVAVVATAASLDTVDPSTGQPWTLLPAWPSFLPIVRELVTFATSHNQTGAAVTVGDPLSGDLPPHWAAEAIQIERPDGRVDTVPVEREEAQVRWNYGSTDVPGVYAARSESGANAATLAAINVDPRESDTSRVDVDLLSPHLSVVTDLSTQGATPSAMSSTPLHRWLLHTVLALLLVESTLAWWFGRGSA